MHVLGPWSIQLEDGRLVVGTGCGDPEHALYALSHSANAAAAVGLKDQDQQLPAPQRCNTTRNTLSSSGRQDAGGGSDADGGEGGIRVRFHIIRNVRIENVGQSQPCMVSKLRIIWKQTVDGWVRLRGASTPRRFATAGLLPNGKVLVTGGLVGSALVEWEKAAEVWDPQTGQWSSPPPVLPPYEHVTWQSTLCPLPSGCFAGPLRKSVMRA